jgi:uncharacterized membrane protein
MTDPPEGEVPLDRNPTPEREAEGIFETHEDAAKRLRNQNLEQDIQERRKYAKRSFNLTCAWLIFIVLSTTAQFVLNALGIGLDRYEFIALITTTTSAVLGFWLLVGRYLFRSSTIPDGGSPPDGNRYASRQRKIE